MHCTKPGTRLSAKAHDDARNGKQTGERLHHPSAKIATAVSGVLRALPLCAPVALAIPAAVAQSVEPAKLIADIPSQPLPQALAAFARQTDLHLVYVSGIARNQKSHAVPAGLGADAALSRLLEGTGLRFEYLTANSVRILAAAPPPETGTLRVRYDWSVATCRPFAMLGASHIAAMSNAPASFPDGNAPGQTPPTTTLLKYTIPAYTAYDAALGVVKDNWTAQVTGSNLSNAYAATNISSGQFIKAAIPLRPRALMALFAYRF